MNRKQTNILLAGILLLDILGNSGIALLTIVKYALLILCLILNNRKGET